MAIGTTTALLAGAAASVGGAALASSASKSAAKTQAQAADNATQAQLQAQQEALAAQERQYQRAVALFRPYVDQGNQADAIINAALYGSGTYTPNLPVLPNETAANTSYATNRRDTRDLHFGGAGGDFSNLPGGYLNFDGDEPRHQPIVYAPQPAPNLAPSTTYTGGDVLRMARESPWGELNRDAVARAVDEQRGYASNAGSFFSGRNLAATADINQRYDQNAFDNWYGGIQGRSARGSDARGTIASGGQNYANTAAGIYTATGNNVANNYLRAGDATAAGQRASADAWAGGINGALYGLSRAFNGGGGGSYYGGAKTGGGFYGGFGEYYPKGG